MVVQITNKLIPKSNRHVVHGHAMKQTHKYHITPYSLNWEFVNSQNKVSDVFDLNMSRICGGKEWIL